jgi:hypothetical protein
MLPVLRSRIRGASTGSLSFLANLEHKAMARLDASDRSLALGRIAYEVGMLCLSPQYHAAAAKSDECMGQALAIESTLIHARSLFCFFFRAGRKDDIVAGDFVAKWASSPPPYLSEHLDRINKMLAHLTCARLKYIRSGDIKWDLSKMRGEIIATFLIFLGKVPPDIATQLEQEIGNRFRIKREHLVAYANP